MFETKSAFNSFSVPDLATAKQFYSDVLGLRVDDEGMGLRLHTPGGGTTFIYPKSDHQPATFTVLNFIVGDIDKAVDDLASRGIKFEQYGGEIQTDARGVHRGDGPTIAWCKDPSGN